MAILVHSPEVIPKQYLLPQDKGRGEISSEKARKDAEVADDMVDGRSFEEEAIRRWAGGEEGKEQVVEELKKGMTNKLVEADEKGGLVPPLLHPLDGRIYVFKRKEDEEEEVQIVSLRGSCPNGGENEEAPAGKRKRKVEGDISGYDSSGGSWSGFTYCGTGIRHKSNKEGPTTDNPNISLIHLQNPNPNHTNDSSVEIFSDSSPTSSTEEDDEPDRSSQLPCINETTFLHSNLYTSSTPPTQPPLMPLPSASPTFTAPSPLLPPSLLSRLPHDPTPTRKLPWTWKSSQSIIADDILYKMRLGRAGEKAAKILDGE